MEIPGYKILGTIGQGGMALVYEAIQKSLHRKVALKVLSPALVADPEFCQRFLEEGKTVARLSHPNIVTIFDIGNHENHYFMSMEYINDGNLRTRIESGLEEKEVISIARQIAKALGYAHDHGFLHRDVKPHNILFRNDGTAVLSDFGIAKNLSENSELTRAGKSLGSPMYMSPEQIRNESLDVRSDLYSLGIVIYQMLTGYVPYLATTADSTTRMHLSCPLPKLPKDLGKFQPLIRRLLAKSKNNRFMNAWELIEALDGVALDSSMAEMASARTTQQIEKTIAMTPLTPSEKTPQIPTPEITQELDDEARKRALENPELSRIFATRDEEGESQSEDTLDLTQETSATLARKGTVSHSRNLSLGIGFLAVLAVLGALTYSYLRTSTGDSREAVVLSPSVIEDAQSQPTATTERAEVKVTFGSDEIAVPKAQAKVDVAPVQVTKKEKKAEPEIDTSVAPQPSVPSNPAVKESEFATLAELSYGDSLHNSEQPSGHSNLESAAVSKIEPVQAMEFHSVKPSSVPVDDVVNLSVESEPDLSKSTSAVAFNSLQDPGLVKVNGDYWISHELENILRRDSQKILRLGDGSLLVSLAQNELFDTQSDRFMPGATDRLDRLAYVLRNYSGFTISIAASEVDFGTDQVLDVGHLRVRRINEYLAVQLNNPQRLQANVSSGSSDVEGGSVDFRLVPVPVL